MDKKLNVAILGATGMVGQRFVTLLNNHPWFNVKIVAASKKSKGMIYEEAVNGRWKMNSPIPDKVSKLVVKDIYEIDQIASEVDFCFCAVDMSKDEIRSIEEAYAKKETPVISNNSAHRITPDVPMLIPEINPEHAEVIEFQRKRLNTKRGFIAVKPNCSIQSYTPVISAFKKYEPYEVIVTTYQAVSGAGKLLSDWKEMSGNIIPYIKGEEEKSEKEPLKIFGHIEKGIIVSDNTLNISAQCIRVPVADGHTAASFIKLRKKASREELIEKLKTFSNLPAGIKLPSAPKNFIQYLEDEDRPQVQKDVNYENGMGISIGRLRSDSIYDWKFIGLSHNTLRGAAGGAVECAELLKELSYITEK